MCLKNKETIGFIQMPCLSGLHHGVGEIVVFHHPHLEFVPVR